MRSHVACIQYMILYLIGVAAGIGYIVCNYIVYMNVYLLDILHTLI